MKQIVTLVFFFIFLNINSQTYSVKFFTNYRKDSTFKNFNCEVYFSDTTGMVQFTDSLKSTLILIQNARAITISNSEIIRNDTFISIENVILNFLGIDLPFDVKDSILFFQTTKIERLRKLKYKKSYFTISNDYEGFHCLKYKNLILSLTIFSKKNNCKVSFHYKKSSLHFKKRKGKQKQLMRYINQFY